MDERKAQHLLNAAKLVYERFMSGHHLSIGQLERLGGAIDACEAMKTCGHLVDDRCDCFADYPASLEDPERRTE